MLYRDLSSLLLCTLFIGLQGPGSRCSFQVSVINDDMRWYCVTFSFCSHVASEVVLTRNYSDLCKSVEAVLGKLLSKVACYSYKLLDEKSNLLQLLVTFFKCNLLQLLLHFKSNKLLYKLLYRYFITSLKLQGF